MGRFSVLKDFEGPAPICVLVARESNAVSLLRSDSLFSVRSSAGSSSVRFVGFQRSRESGSRSNWSDLKAQRIACASCLSLPAEPSRSSRSAAAEFCSLLEAASTETVPPSLPSYLFFYRLSSNFLGSVLYFRPDRPPLQSTAADSLNGSSLLHSLKSSLSALLKPSNFLWADLNVPLGDFHFSAEEFESLCSAATGTLKLFYSQFF